MYLLALSRLVFLSLHDEYICLSVCLSVSAYLLIRAILIHLSVCRIIKSTVLIQKSSYDCDHTYKNASYIIYLLS